MIDDVSEIDIKKAKKVEPDLELGDPYIEIINPEDFGRRLINTGKQFLAQSIRNIEKQAIFEEFNDYIDDFVKTGNDKVSEEAAKERRAERRAAKNDA